MCWLFVLAGLVVILPMKRTFGERDLFFPQPSILSAWPPGVEPISVASGDGTILRGAGVGRPENGTLLYFYGNGELVDLSLDRMFWLSETLKLRVICFDYRGYGHSGGVPGLDSLVSDAGAILASQRTEATPVYVYGRSIGTICALSLAAENELNGLILEAPFTSAADVGMAWTRNLPLWMRPLMKLVPDASLANRIQPVQLIGQVHAPLLVIHGTDDTIIPMELGMRMVDAAGSGEKTFCQVPGSGHNDLDISRDPTRTALITFFAYGGSTEQVRAGK